MSVAAHNRIQRFFPGVAEGRMPDVVNERKRLDEVDVQAKLGGDSARNLRYLERVREAIAKMIGIAAGKNLSFGFKAAKGAGVNDAVAVALEIVAIRMGRLGKTASAGLFHAHRIVGEHEGSLAEASAIGLPLSVRRSIDEQRTVPCDQVAVQGSTRSTPQSRKSATLRVAIVAPNSCAMAAICASA